MNSGIDRSDDGFGDRLRELDAAGAADDTVVFEEMFSDVKSRCERSDRTLAGFLRGRSTRARRHSSRVMPS